jgi:hypothetical protein
MASAILSAASGSAGISCDDIEGQTHCLSRGQSIGLAVAAEASFLSLVAVLILFAYIVVSSQQQL